MKGKNKRCIAALWLCVLTSGLVQARTVSITGQVLDATASPVVDATLSL